MSERKHDVRVAVLAVVAGLGLTACTGGGSAQSNEKSSETGVSAQSSSSVPSSGACAPFRVYAQNRWAPLGAAERSRPDVLAPKIGSYAGNEVIAVDGWIRTGVPVYPTNTPPWNSDIWYHEANRDGWVSFPGVRGVPTVPDPTGHADGGMPAPTPAECEEAYTPQ